MNLACFATALLAIASLVLPSTPRPALAQEASGQDLYLQLCASCHGSDLTGGLGPNLIDDEWMYGAEHLAQAVVIRDGVPASGMPAFGAVLSNSQIDSILDFILRASQDPSIAPSRTVDTLSSLDYEINVEIFADGLEIPWAIEFLDAQRTVITERPGRLRLVENGVLRDDPVRGTPQVLHEGQGGLLDVTADPDYASNGWIYLAYSHVLEMPDEERDGTMTRIVRGRIVDNAWTDEQVVFEAPRGTYRPTRHHYGSRIVFDPQGRLYFSIGDRGFGDDAQDLARPNGKIHRVNPDGSIPSDNPFVGVDGALPSIYSYGHRNPQGLTIHPVTGEVWAVEHGPLGGDELNRPQPGKNYGWPEISYGINYNGTIMTEYRRREGMEQPILYWRPSIAVSGLSFYTGEAFPRWRNHLIVGALAYEEVRLLDMADDRVMHQEVILKDAGRVREAVPGPDGAIYVVLNDPGQVLRLTPKREAIRGR